MVENFDKIMNEALSLPAGARVMLAEHLLESLDLEEQKDIDKAWALEAEKRYAEIKEGKVKPLPGDDVLKELHSKYDS